ncbi:hypothetical protein [Microbacterium sp. PMB16]|uniref:hypothetical protein n=1 Tax=Microbacterium sp. PMB16 TaxID=3120157 RepID=UPI003F4CA0D2
MADYDRFDTLRDAAKEHGRQGNTTAAASNLAEALAVARAGLAEEPAAWYPRLGMVQMDIERSSPSQELTAASEAATREVIAYAKEGADDDPTRLDLLSSRLNSLSMELEAEQRNEESLALAEELLALLTTHPSRPSELAHTRRRTAELRLVTGDPAGALELADALVEDELRLGSGPGDGTGGLSSWLRLRARVRAALGREADARADFDASLARQRARVDAGGFFLADLDLADGLDEHAVFLRALGASDEARTSAEEAERIRAESERLREEKKRR